MSENNDINFEPSIITRELNAPKQLVFDAWTQVDHLKNWQFPMKGARCEYTHADISPGGSSLHKMMMPNGFEMWLLTKYEVVDSPDKLVFRQYMSNEAGEIVQNPQMPTWPKEMRLTINFEEVAGKTKLELIWEPVDPTKEEAETFKQAGQQSTQGWSMGLDQLEDYLSRL